MMSHFFSSSCEFLDPSVMEKDAKILETITPESYLGPLHDSKTVPMGIINTAHTCYVNTTIHMLYNLPLFRDLMYRESTPP